MKGKLFSFIKFSLFFINLLFVVASLAIIGFGVLIRINGFKAFSFYSEIVALLMIVFGVIVFFIALSGCWGAISEIKCLLITFIVVTLILAVAIIAGVVVMFTNPTILQKLTGIIIESKKNASEFNMLESLVKCCGMAGPSSYEKPDKTVSLPLSCCPIDTITNSNDNKPTCDLDHAYKEGCVKSVDLIVTEHIKPTAYSLIVIALFTIINTLSAIYLCFYISKRESYGYRKR